MEPATQLFLLVITCLAALATGQTLKCIQCQGESCKTETMPKDCMAGQDHCYTEVVSTPGARNNVAKGCAVFAECQHKICCTTNSCNIGLPLQCVTCTSEAECRNAQPTFCTNPMEITCFTAVGETGAATYLNKGCMSDLDIFMPSIVVARCHGDSCNAPSPLKCVTCDSFDTCTKQNAEFCTDADARYCYETAESRNIPGSSDVLILSKGCTRSCMTYSKDKTYTNHCCQKDGCNNKSLLNAATAPSAHYLAGLSLPLMMAILH